MRRALLLLAVVALNGCGSLIVTQIKSETLAAKPGFTWTTQATDDFVIYVEPGSPGERKLDTIELDAAQAKQRVLEVLDETGYPPVVFVFVVDSRDRMKQLIGRRSNAVAYYSTNTMCIIVGETIRVGAAHELLHVVAMNAWGVPQRWINEGLAVYADGQWSGHDTHALCRYLQQQGQLPSLYEITRRFGKLPGLVSYPAAGSFTRYLYETHGLETVKAVWDGDKLSEATGMSVDELDVAWRRVLASTDAQGITYEISSR